MTTKVKIDPAMASLRGKLGGYRSRAKDDPELVATKQALAEAKLLSDIEKLIANAPALTPSQALKLRSLLDIEGAK